MFLLFALGFLAGTLWVGLGREGWLMAATWLEPDFLWKIEHISVDKRALFFLTAGKRLRAFFLLWLLSYSLFRRVGTLGYFLYGGLCAGCVMELLIIKYGITGLLFYLGLILPQALFYIPGYMLMGNFCLRRARGYGMPKKAGQKKNLGRAGLVLGILMAGAFLESYVNPEGIKILVKLLLS